MSRISELANSFKQETERLERNTQIALNQTLSKYESSINDSLKTSQKAIENSMKEIVENEYQKQQQQAQKRLNKVIYRVRWATGGLIALIVVAVGVGWYIAQDTKAWIELKATASKISAMKGISIEEKPDTIYIRGNKKTTGYISDDGKPYLKIEK